jgi:signal transduction histidine kinase/CheY-like chemotaxis protein
MNPSAGPWIPVSEPKFLRPGIYCSNFFTTVTDRLISSRSGFSGEDDGFSDAFRERQIQVLERVAAGANPEEIHELVIALIERQVRGCVAAVMILAEDGRHLRPGAPTGLPEAFAREIDSLEIGPRSGSCGTAVYLGRRVIVRDIETDPLWEGIRDTALRHGLRSAWAEPVFAVGGGRVLGALVVYHALPSEPQEDHLRVIRVAAHLVSIGLERHRREAAREEAERRRMELEKKLIEAQKSESLVVLAGGIAHDFNNLLTGVLGYGGLLRQELPPDSPLQVLVKGVEDSALRAADLCKQMLACAGQGCFVIEPMDISTLVRDSERLLRLAIGMRATLHLELAPDLPPVDGDVAQLRQILVNLVTNAAEASGDQGGAITLRTGRGRFDRNYFRDAHLSPDLPEGDYVYLEVTDAGCGMDAETRSKIFDPFFTTKFIGRGLGLPAVLGIVRGHRGALKVESEPGKGATFRLLLPCHARAADEAAPAHPDAMPNAGKVLIVDDERTVREVTADMVAALGFETLTAADGQEGVEVFRAHAPEVGLVLLDLTMPRMSGEEAFREMRRMRPDVRVVLMSGFTEKEATSQFAGKRLAGFLQKPFSMDALKARLAPEAAVPGAPAADALVAWASRPWPGPQSRA